MRDKYKHFRVRLKSRYFDAYSTNEERLNNLPPDVTKEDWTWLVNWFNSNEFQRISDRNKQNRSKQVMWHSSGSRSFACLERDKINNNNGVHPGAYALFKKNHTDKYGVPLDEKTQTIIEVEKQAADWEEENGEPVDKNQIYEELRMSEHKRMRVSKMSKIHESEQLRQFREEVLVVRAALDKSRSNFEAVKQHARATNRRAEHSVKTVLDMNTTVLNLNRDMETMENLMRASGLFVSIEPSQDPNP